MSRNRNKEFTERESQQITDNRLRDIVDQVPKSRRGAGRVVDNSDLTPLLPVKVTSTFETRPINAQDFFRSGGSIAFSTTTLVDDTETATFSFTVPNGRVAILRQFGWQFDPIYVDSTITSMTTFISADNQRVANYDSILDLQYIEDRIPAHFIFPEKTVITITSIRLSTVSLAARALTATPTYLAQLYGNLLLGRGLPTNFEIGNLR